MEIYKYLNSSAAQKFLENWSIGFSHPTELNDPFELIPLPTQPSQEERAQEINLWADNHIKTHQNIDPKSALGLATWAVDHYRKMGEGEIKNLIKESLYWVTCFSRTETNLLMWSHYAGDSGMVIGIDTDSPLLENRLHPVLYSQKRPQIDTRTFDPSGPPPKFAFTKSLDWAYEQEERVIISKLEEPNFENASRIKVDKGNGNSRDLLLIPIAPNCVRRIIFGNRFFLHTQNKGLVAKLSGNNETNHITLNMAQIDSEEYRINCIELPEKFAAA